MNNRELASTDMRAKMFDTLMTHYFRFEHDATNDLSSEAARRQKHTILRLIALNFDGSFSFKPLFEELAETAKDKNETDNLRKSARFVVNRQLDAMTTMNSLLTGKGTGKIAKSGLLNDFW